MRESAIGAGPPVTTSIPCSNEVAFTADGYGALRARSDATQRDAMSGSARGVHEYPGRFFYQDVERFG